MLLNDEWECTTLIFEDYLKMHYIIFDLEATCWKNKQEAPGKPEIIEIGAVKLDSNGNEMDKLKQFVKPTHFPELSEFCTETTFPSP